MTKEQEYKNTIKEIVEQNDLKSPMTVYQSGKLLSEYLGVEEAIRIFEEVQEETKHNIFRTSAFGAVLDTLLIPMRNDKE